MNALLTIAVILVLALVVPPHLGNPADPTDVAYIPRPEWYFLPLYQLLKLVPGSMESVVAVGIPSLLGIVLVAMPFVDRRSARNILHRPVALAGLAVVLGGSGLLHFRNNDPRLDVAVHRSAGQPGRLVVFLAMASTAFLTSGMHLGSPLPIRASAANALM